MNRNDVIIPKAMQLVLDDFGWFYGRDVRDQGGPARAGFPREFEIEDYEMMNEIGKAINQKVMGMFVVGEWDREGVLANVPNASWAGKNWNGSRWYNPEKAKQIVELYNRSENLEWGVHGLLHDVWDENGVLLGGGEYFPFEGDVPSGKRINPSEEYFRAHLDAYFKIYDTIGFKDRPRAFTAPCGGKTALLSDIFAKTLKSYGLIYWHNTFEATPDGGKVELGDHYVKDGTSVIRAAYVLCLWENYDLDPDELPEVTYETSGLIAGHWPNILRFPPKKSKLNLPAWVDFFNRNAEIFGNMISRDIAFAHKQYHYAKHSVITEENGEVVIDFSEVDALNPFGETPPVYISVKKSAAAPKFIGGEAKVYEEKNDFITYEVRRDSSGKIIVK